MYETSVVIGRGLQIYRNDSGWYRLNRAYDPPLTEAEVRDAISRMVVWIIHTSPPPAPGPAQSVEDHFPTAQDALVEMYEHLEVVKHRTEGADHGKRTEKQTR